MLLTNHRIVQFHEVPGQHQHPYSDGNLPPFLYFSFSFIIVIIQMHDVNVISLR